MSDNTCINTILKLHLKMIITMSISALATNICSRKTKKNLINAFNEEKEERRKVIEKEKKNNKKRPSPKVLLSKDVTGKKGKK